MFPPEVDIVISESEDQMGTVFTIEIPEEYRGKLIGKAGRNIKAIRDILSIVARQEQKRVFIKVA